jgi:hypothetical protein
MWHCPFNVAKIYSIVEFHLQDDTLKQQMNSFLLSTQSQHEIQALDNKVCSSETSHELLFHLYHYVNGQSFTWFIKPVMDLDSAAANCSVA